MPCHTMGMRICVMLTSGGLDGGGNAQKFNSG